MNPLDEVPISTRGTYDFSCESELPESTSAEDSGPLESRLSSTLWKTRAQALQELRQRAAAESIAQYLPAAVALLKDANLSVAEAAVEVVRTAVKNGAEEVHTMLEQLLPWIIEKGLISPKTSIKSASSELILDLYERLMDVSPLLERLVQALDNKAPKVQIAAVSALAALLKTFGNVMFPVETVLKMCVSLAASTNPQLRSESLSFFTESYRWSAPLVLPLLDSLKKSQADELRISFQSIPPDPAPLRFPKRPISANATATHLRNTAKSVQDRPAKDIFDKYDEMWVDSVLSLEKWTLKKEALEGLNREIESVAIVEKSPSALVTLVKRCAKDANLQVNLQGIKLAGLLAKGQGPYFEPYGRQLLPCILLKIREKKSSILSEVQTALQHFLCCMKLTAMAEDFAVVFGEKLPVAKVNLVEFIGKVVEGMQEKEAKSVWGVFGPMLKMLMEDSTAEVRKASTTVTTLLLSKAGEPLSTALSGLSSSKLKEMQDALSPQAPPPPKPQTVKKHQPSAVSDTKETTVGDSVVSDESAVEVVMGVIPPDVCGMLESTNWKEKQTGFQSLLEYLKENTDNFRSIVAALLKFISVKCKNWKENNLNVLKSAFELIEFVVSELPLDWKTSEWLISHCITQKLTDAKLSDLLYRCSSHICTKVGIKRVVAVLCKETTDCGKPKVVADACELMKKLISDFGTRSLDLNSFVTYVKKQLSESNPIVKKAAHNLVLTTYQHTGEPLIPLLSGLTKHAYESLLEELKTVELVTAAAYKATEVEESGGNRGVERSNISGKCGRALLQKMNSGDWKERKEGMEELERTLGEVRGGLVPTGLSDLVQMLRLRLSDPNKTLQKGFLALVGKFGELLGSEGKIYAKTMLSAAIGCLTDKQQMIRQTALGVVEKWAKIADIDTVVNLCSQSLQQDNGDLRQDLLPWLLSFKDSLKAANNLSVLIPSLLQCLQDRAAGIRNSAELVFSEIVDQVPVDLLENALKDLKPTIVNSLQPVLNKYRKQDPKKPAKAPKIEEKRSTYSPTPLPAWLTMSESEQISLYSAEVNAVLSVDLSQRFQDIEGSVGFCALQVKGLLRTAGPYSFHSLVLKWMRLLWLRKVKVDIVTLKTVVEPLVTLYAETHVSMLDSEASVLSPFLSLDISPADQPLLDTVIEGLSRVCAPNLIYNSVVSSLLTEIHNGFQSVHWVKPLVSKNYLQMIGNCSGKHLLQLYETAPTIGRELITATAQAAGDRFWPLFPDFPDNGRPVMQRLFDAQKPPVAMKPRKSVTFAAPAAMAFSPSLTDLIHITTEGAMGDKVEALTRLCEWVENAEDREFLELVERKEEVINALDGLVRGVVKQESAPKVFARFVCKVLAKVCSESRLAQRFSTPDLVSLIDLFISSLLHDSIQSQDPTVPDSLHYILNTGLLLLLENSDANNVFAALFESLRVYSAERAVPRVVPALIKSLLKLIKVVENLLPRMDIGALLLSLSRLLDAVPRPASGSTSSDDAIAKVAKTLINELAKQRKTALWEDYNRVVSEMKDDRDIVRWIGGSLLALGYEAGSVYQRVRSPLKNRGNHTVVDPLLHIFETIRSEGSYSEGVKELAEYIQRHPECELTMHTRTLTEDLMAKVTEDLAKLKKPRVEQNSLRSKMEQIKSRFALGETENGVLGTPKTSIQSLKQKWENIRALKSNFGFPQP